MELADRAVGLILTLTSLSIFTYYTFWVIILVSSYSLPSHSVLTFYVAQTLQKCRHVHVGSFKSSTSFYGYHRCGDIIGESEQHSWPLQPKFYREIDVQMLLCPFSLLLIAIISCTSIFYHKNTLFSFLYMLQWRWSAYWACLLDTSCSSPRRRRHDVAAASPLFALSSSW